MNEDKEFEGLEPINLRNNVGFTRAMIQQMYGIGKAGVIKQINKAKEDGRISVDSKLEPTKAADGKVYDTEIFTLDDLLELSFYIRNERTFAVRDWLKGLAKKELLKLKEEKQALRVSSDTAWRMLDQQDREDLY